MNGLALCSGIGGFERELPTRTICYVERDAYAAAVLVAAMERRQLAHAPIWCDVKTFSGKPWRGAVDIITAGFPCQPHSLAGAQRGENDERWLWPEIVRIVRDVRPRYLYLENVTAILISGFSTIIGDLASIGYDAQWDCLGACCVGAPHKRARMFCLASNTKRARLERSVPIPRWGRSTTRSHRWDTASELCRVDDGTPHRIHRLRALGNAVVPAQGARAFEILVERG